MTNEAVLSTKKEKHLITEKIQRQKKLKNAINTFRCNTVSLYGKLLINRSFSHGQLLPYRSFSHGQIFPYRSFSHGQLSPHRSFSHGELSPNRSF